MTNFPEKFAAGAKIGDEVKNLADKLATLYESSLSSLFLALLPNLPASNFNAGLFWPWMEKVLKENMRKAVKLCR